MEDQAQKTEALKKAYAEIILNTAKEAANRAMVSECKALRFHHDLHNTKDEALRMLLRFKHIIDAKTTEAEMTTLGQQKRIEELDAQLNVTEGVIVDLREELRKAHERLEEVKKSHMLQSNEPFENEHMHDIEDTAHDKKIDATEQFRSSSQCSDSENETETSGPHLDNFFIGNPNLASVNIGSKEPEFCRNGHTHRIRAIEKNQVDGNNISEDKPAEDLCIKKEFILNVDEKSSEKRAPSSIDAESEDMNTDAKNINGSGALSITSSVAKDQPVKVQRLPRNGVIYAQSNPKLSRFYSGVIKPTAEKVDLKENSLGKDEKLLETNEQNGCTLRRSIRKRKVRCLDEISSLFKPHTALSRCKKNSGNGGMKLDEHQYKYKSVAEMNQIQMIDPISPSTNASEETKDDELPGPLHMYPVENTQLLNESVVEKHEVAAKESAEHTGGSACNNDKNRLLKYTFSRKRKRNLSFKSEQEKPSLIEDSSGDSQNLVEVACQLILLSGGT